MGHPAGTRKRQAEECREALRLHVMGLTQPEIADHLAIHFGRLYSQSTVSRRISRAVQRYTIPEIQDIKRVELARLDALLEAMSSRLVAGDPRAVQQALGIMDRRSKYLGLDKPVQAEVAVTVTPDLSSVEDRLRLLAERLAVQMVMPQVPALPAGDVQDGVQDAELVEDVR